MPHNSHEPDAHQQQQHQREPRRNGDVGLLRPHEVHDARERGQVDEAVERRPPPAESPDRGLRRRQRERHEQQEAGKADGDVRALRDVPGDLAPRERIERDLPVEHHVDEEMDRDVRERPEADQATVVDQPVQVGQPPQRRDRQGGGDQEQAPPAGAVLDLLDPFAVDPPGKQVERDQRERQETQQVQQRPAEPLQKFLRRSMPA